MRSRRFNYIAGAVVGLLLVYAWVDGGEEPLHPITEPVQIPAIVR